METCCERSGDENASVTALQGVTTKEGSGDDNKKQEVEAASTKEGRKQMPGMNDESIRDESEGEQNKEDEIELESLSSVSEDDENDDEFEDAEDGQTESDREARKSATDNEDTDPTTREAIEVQAKEIIEEEPTNDEGNMINKKEIEQDDKEELGGDVDDDNEPKTDTGEDEDDNESEESEQDDNNKENREEEEEEAERVDEKDRDNGEDKEEEEEEEEQEGEISEEENGEKGKEDEGIMDGDQAVEEDEDNEQSEEVEGIDRDKKSQESENDETREEESKTEKKPVKENNPALVPRRSSFFMHDNRFLDDNDPLKHPEPEEQKPSWRYRSQFREDRSGMEAEKWDHDLYIEEEQVPKREWERHDYQERRGKRRPYGRKWDGYRQTENRNQYDHNRDEYNSDVQASRRGHFPRRGLSQSRRGYGGQSWQAKQRYLSFFVSLILSFHCLTATNLIMMVKVMDTLIEEDDRQIQMMSTRV
jgi:hypothetical protein